MLRLQRGSCRLIDHDFYWKIIKYDSNDSVCVAVAFFQDIDICLFNLGNTLSIMEEDIKSFKDCRFPDIIFPDENGQVVKRDLCRVPVPPEVLDGHTFYFHRTNSFSIPEPQRESHCEWFDCD